MNDEDLMGLAVAAAKQAGVATWWNPGVGAVVVKNGHVLATGHTQPYGGPHAERDALSQLAPGQAAGATLYVTLEPCNHYGKQPPCTQLIIDSGIQRVVIAQLDPHALVTGKGVAALRHHGIEVVTGIGTQQAAQVNPHYNFFYRHHRPWVTLKQAVSLDGRISAGPGQRTAITNQAVYQRVHQERAGFQGIVIGSTTAIVDDPTLVPTPQLTHLPIRVVLDRRGRLADYPDRQLFRDGLAPTWVFTERKSLPDRLGPRAWVFVLPDCSVPAVVQVLAEEGVQSLYVEGGPTIQNAFARAGLVEEVLTYLSPVMLGQEGVPGFAPPETWKFQDQQLELLGNNVRIAERERQDV